MIGFLLTLEGSDNPAFTGSPASVTVQTGGPELIPILEGEVRKYVGGNRNDSSEWRWRHVAKLLSFDLSNESAEHPPALLDELLAVLTKRFRRITAVSGLPLWVQNKYNAMLASGAIDVMITGIDFRYPYDNTVDVVLTLENRARGI